jgi:hypothetical protein
VPKKKRNIVQSAGDQSESPTELFSDDDSDFMSPEKSVDITPPTDKSMTFAEKAVVQILKMLVK